MGLLGDITKGIVIWMGVGALFGLISFVNIIVKETIVVVGVSLVMTALFAIVIWHFVLRNQ